MNSNYTGRFARSMQEGINPYASGPVEPMRSKDDRSYRFATWALYVTAVLAIIVIVGVA